MEGWEKCFKSKWEPDPGVTCTCIAWGLGHKWKLPPPSPGRSWEQRCCSGSGQTEPLHPPRAAGPLPAPHWPSPVDKDKKDVPHLHSKNDRWQGPGTWVVGILAILVVGLPRWHSGKEPTCQCRRHKRWGFDPWVGKIPWSRKWHPTLVSLPGKFHGQRRLVGFSPWGCEELDATEQLSTHSLGGSCCHHTRPAFPFLTR